MIFVQRAFLLVVGLAATVALISPAVAAAGNTVSGRVLDETDTPVVAATVRIIRGGAARQKPPAGDAIDAKKLLERDPSDVVLLQHKTDVTVGTGTTDATGRFEVKGIQPGDYRFVVLVKGAKRKTGAVTVKAGEAAALGDLKLDPVK